MPAPLIKSGPIWALLVILVAAAYLLPAAQALEPRPAIDNFDLVAPNIYRGANPKEADLVQLQKLGVTTIVDLRMRRCRGAKEAAERHGMVWRHIPMGYWAPSDKSVRQVLDILRQAGNDKSVFIHCTQGADRTGTLVALYRMKVQNWSYDQAYREMRAHHFKPWWFALREKVETWDEQIHSGSVAVSAEK